MADLYAVVRPDTGQYLGRGTGARRRWVPDLDDADVFKTPGKGKIAYNHVTAFDRRYYPTRELPEFSTRPVRILPAETVTDMENGEGHGG